MTNPYAPPEQYNGNEQTVRVLPLQVKVAIASSSVACAIVIAVLVWFGSGSHDYTTAAISSLAILSPNAFLFIWHVGAETGRDCASWLAKGR
jgi:uncharacterized RDD family membrane protein YckC